MKTSISTYSAILKLEDTPFISLKQSTDRLRWALGLFLIVGLIAGSGKLFGINKQLRRLTYAEQIQVLTLQVESTGQQIERFGQGLTGFAAWLLAEPAQTVGQFLTNEGVEFGENLEESAVRFRTSSGSTSQPSHHTHW